MTIHRDDVLGRWLATPIEDPDAPAGTILITTEYVELVDVQGSLNLFYPDDLSFRAKEDGSFTVGADNLAGMETIYLTFERARGDERAEDDEWVVEILEPYWIERFVLRRAEA